MIPRFTMKGRMIHDEDGNWVRWSDALALFSQLENEIDVLKAREAIGWISRIDAEMIPDSISCCTTNIMRERSDQATVPIFIGSPAPVEREGS